MRVNNSGTELENRVDATRVNVEDVIQELVTANLAQTNEEVDEENEPEECGLQLYVGKDGTATLGSRSGTNQRKKKQVLPKTPSHTSSSNSHHHNLQESSMNQSSMNQSSMNQSSMNQSSMIQSSSMNQTDSKKAQEQDLMLLMQPEPSSQNGSRQSLNDS